MKLICDLHLMESVSLSVMSEDDSVSIKLTEAASRPGSKGLRRASSSVEIRLPVFVPDKPSLGFEDADV